MLNMNIDWYEKLTAEQVWNDIDPNYSIEPDSIVYRSADSEHIVMVSQPIGEDCWCCEIDGIEEMDGKPRWDMIGQGFGDTPDQAIDNAVMDIVGYDVMREEGDCEDAVNVCAYEAYVLINGEEPNPHDDSWLEYDRLKGVAIEFVKDNCESYGFEWEEF